VPPSRGHQSLNNLGVADACEHVVAEGVAPTAVVEPFVLSKLDRQKSTTTAVLLDSTAVLSVKAPGATCQLLLLNNNHCAT
jgi:hypothetical protein